VAPALENGAPTSRVVPGAQSSPGLMVTVLRRLNGLGMLEKYPNLSAYVARGEARPAYKRAFDDQLAVFTGKRPTGLLSSAWSSTRSSRCPEIYRPRP